MVLASLSAPRRRFTATAAGALSCALVAVACGSPSPTLPVAAPAPVPTPMQVRFVTIVSGETSQPVSGAQVIVGGVESTSGADGRATVPPDARSSALVDIVAAGFLDRQTTYGRALASARFPLWPRTSPTGLDEKFTQEIVYTTFGEDATVGAAPMRRWRSSLGPVRVLLGKGFDPSAGRSVDNQVDAARQMNDLLGDSLEYMEPVFSDEEPDAGVVVVKVDPDAETCDGNVLAFASFYVYTNGEIGKVDIVYCTVLETQRINIVRHEFGHSLGLRHSFEPSDLMYPYDTSDRFTERERLAVRLMYQRPTGNRYPDNDREATASATWGRVETVVCGS